MKRRDQPIFDGLFELLKCTPIWVGPVVSIVVFAVLRVFIPLLIPAPKVGAFDVGAILRPAMPSLAWIFAVAILLLWTAAELHKWFNRKLLDTRSSVASLNEIPWPEFEHLVCEAYGRQGYLAQVVGSPSGDGGVDIRLRKHGQLVLVQCKRWEKWNVGVQVVREMFGVVVSQNATKGIIVTSSRFTGEARRFAQSANPPIQLIDGTELFGMIQSVQKRPGAGGSSNSPPTSTPVTSAQKLQAQTCPDCGSIMVLRTARKGRNIGSQFWGCTNFPDCRGRRSHL